MTRVVTRPYGPTLVVHFAGRIDQIHFKLFAMVDQGGGRHESEYLLASHARALIERIGRNLQTAGVDLPRRSPSDAPAYLPAFEAAANTILASLGTAPAQSGA